MQRGSDRKNPEKSKKYILYNPYLNNFLHSGSFQSQNETNASKEKYLKEIFAEAGSVPIYFDTWRISQIKKKPLLK